MLIIKPDRLRFAITYYAQRLFMLPLVWIVFRVLNRVEVEGLEHLDEVEGEAVILAPNHTTAWDGWVGTVWALSSRRRLIERDSYLAVFAAPENIPTPFLRLLTAVLGAIPVDREQGVEQPALRDTVRLFHEGRRKVVLTMYPEGTRSKDGRLRRRGKPGLGWVQHQTGAVVVPIYHTGGRLMPGVGLCMKLRIGKPIRLEQYRGQENALATWRAVTEEVMDALRAMQVEADEVARRSPRRARRLGWINGELPPTAPPRPARRPRTEARSALEERVPWGASESSVRPHVRV